MTISKFFTPALTLLLALGSVVPAQASVSEVSSQKKNYLHQLAQDHQEDQLVPENQQSLDRTKLEIASRRFGRRGFSRRGHFRRGRSFRRGNFGHGRGFRRRGHFRRARDFRRGNFHRGNFRRGDFVIKKVILR